MRKPTQAQIAWRAAEESAATDAGAAWHQANPDAMLCEAWRHADSLYGPERPHQAHAFYQAFRNARAQREAYQQESQP